MGSHKKTSAPRGPLGRLVDLERLLEATLGGFGATQSLADADPDADAGVTLDVLGRAHQVDPVRFIGDRRRAYAARCEALFAR